MSSPKISIVVPVYNTEKYLEECVSSILLQTFKDFELILVNDGSVDKSAEICNRVAREYEQIRVFHQQNAGVTRARAKGVQEAYGEWICFVDSDDTLPVDALEKLNEATEDDTDIVVGFMETILQQDKWIDIFSYRKCCISGERIDPGPVAKLFRKSLFDSFVFDMSRQIVMGEDMLMNIRLSFMTEKDIRFVLRKVYNYRRHDDSCVARFLPTWEYEQVYHQERLCSIPENERLRYMPACIQNRLNALNLLLYRNYKVDWRNTSFVRELQTDVRKMNYSLPFKWKVFLNNQSDMVILFWRTLKSVLKR